MFEAMNIRVRLVEDCVSSSFANIFLRTSYVRSVFEGDAKQAIGQASISQPQVAGLKIAVPPVPEQHRIVSKVEELMALCDRLEASLTTADETRRRLLVALLAEALSPALTIDREAAE